MLNFNKTERLLYKELIKERRKNLIVTACFFIMALFFAVLLFFFAYTQGYFVKPSADFNYPLWIEDNVKFENMSESQIEEVKNILYQVDSMYLEPQKEITITTTFEQYEKDKDIAGFNRGKGTVFVEYSKSEWFLKNIICHELLHTGVGSGELYHEWVYDMAGQGVCYKK